MTNDEFKLLKIDSNSLCGVYNFGDSESEANVIILSTLGSYIVQVCSHSFIDYDGEVVIVPIFRTYNAVSLDSLQIYFGKYTAHNADYYGVEFDSNKALLINGKIRENTTYSSDTYDVGFKYATLEEIFEGYPYPQVFYKNVDVSYLDSLSLDSLILIKNSVYARYGYIFKYNLEMIEYFNTKSWYTPAYNKVDQWFTLIEQRNLRVINKCIKKY